MYLWGSGSFLQDPPGPWTVQGKLCAVRCGEEQLRGKAREPAVPHFPSSNPMTPWNIPSWVVWGSVRGIGSGLGPVGYEWGGEQEAFLWECSVCPQVSVEFRVNRLVHCQPQGGPLGAGHQDCCSQPQAFRDTAPSLPPSLPSRPVLPLPALPSPSKHGLLTLPLKRSVPCR